MDALRALQLIRSPSAWHLPPSSSVLFSSNELPLLLSMQQLPLITLLVMAPLRSLQLRDGTFSLWWWSIYSCIFMSLYINILHTELTDTDIFSFLGDMLVMPHDCGISLSLTLHFHLFEIHWLHVTLCTRMISRRRRSIKYFTFRTFCIEKFSSPNTVKITILGLSVDELLYSAGHVYIPCAETR